MLGRLTTGLFKALLLVYPRPFREKHSAEMVGLFQAVGDEVHRTRGRWAHLAHVGGAFLDVVRSGIGARLDARRKHRPTESSRGAVKSDHMDAGRGGGGMESIVKDVAYAVRTLVKNPGFAVVATVTIALGIGANTAIFSVVRAVLLQPLPYEAPQELVLLWGEMQARDVRHFPMSPPDFASYRDESEGLEDLAAVFTFPTSLTGDGDPVQVTAAGVTTNFFSLLGVEPVLGRTFVPEDGTPQPPGAAPGQPGFLPGIAILSHGLWQRRYGASPDVIGRTIQLNGGPSEIIGVLPPGFDLLMPATAALAADTDVWLSARVDFVNAPANNVFLRPVGRLADGWTTTALQAELDRIAADLAATDQVKASAGYAVRVESLHEDLTADVRPVILTLFGAVLFVLLIACANVSNLLLVRASNRDRELAVRAALGGSRGRLIRQMLMESLLLAGAGATIGILFAAGGVQLLLALQPDDLPRIESVRIDGVVLLFTLVAAMGAALVFGLLPALQGSRVDLADALKERGGAGGSSARRFLRNGVVVIEVALSLVLLIGAGLMVRSFVELASVTPGFEPEGVLTFAASPSFGTYPQSIDRVNFNVQLRERLQAIPGVQHAGLASSLPLTGALLNGRYGPEEARTDPEQFGQATYRAITPGYFDAMGTRLLAGRTFTLADNLDSASVVVVDDELAERLWPGESAIGKRFLVRVLAPEPVSVEVIGVVEHQRDQDLASVGMETVYFVEHYFGAFGGSWAVRTSGDPLALTGAIREAVAAVDGNVPVADVLLMESYVDRAMAPTRFALTLIGVFGIVAMLLASIGLYGVLSYVVRQRTAEIGVRMAFGAEPGTILRLVVGQGLGLAGAGVLLGLLAAVPLTRALESLLVGVAPTDPVTFGGISLIFVLVAAVACYLPARRATFVDPVTALRND